MKGYMYKELTEEEKEDITKEVKNRIREKKEDILKDDYITKEEISFTGALLINIVFGLIYVISKTLLPIFIITSIYNLYHLYILIKSKRKN